LKKGETRDHFFVEDPHLCACFVVQGAHFGTESALQLMPFSSQPLLQPMHLAADVRKSRVNLASQLQNLQLHRGEPDWDIPELVHVVFDDLDSALGFDVVHQHPSSA